MAIVSTIFVGVWTATGLSPAWADRSDYVGPAACGGCHVAAYEVWRSSAHARAGESLGAGQVACLACHTTGAAPAGRAYFGGVTCEACHGPGAGYSPADIMQNPTLAQALGLRDLSTPERRAALCQRCHQSALRIAPFDAEDAYRQIEHHLDPR